MCPVVRNSSASLECPRGATTGSGFKRATRWASQWASQLFHSTWRKQQPWRQEGKWVVNHRLRLESVALGRSCYCLLISAVQLEANRLADVLVNTLHCKTEQRRASVLCQLGVQLAASRPIDIVRVISLIHRSICQSRLRSQPVCLSNYFANKATILANNAHTVMIQQKVRYQKR